MGKLNYSMKSFIATALIAAFASGFCTEDPSTVSNFDAEDFAGQWFMQSSTFYANDEVGCITFTISEPNSKDKLDAGLHSVKLFGISPLNAGEIKAESYSLSYDTSGALSYKNLLVIPKSFYKVLDTDYTSYAVVYECTTNPYKFLNYRNDDVHILTRDETVTDANLDTWKAIAETKISGSEDRFEDL